ncbi:hypothetical protein H2O77_10955 [Cobetia sp. 4B]|uniref:hypothetical protein n=1 Tax=Cobetia sp. 4B TaxID=2758724 RepID=UPI001C04C772|nr:hypothetical protein [Cobetia sp. 4B]QWN35827.1 hypothetical protein H2O77_10955 [Cobetia sp. 4B]
MSLYTRLDNTSIDVVKGIKNVCAKGEDDFLNNSFPDIYNVALLYHQKKWQAVIEEANKLNARCGPYIMEIISYIRCLASYNIHIDKNPHQFLYNVELLPYYMQDYFLGLHYYNSNRYEEAYSSFSKARFNLSPFVNERWDYLESSMRGINSAISFAELDGLYNKFPEVPLDAFGYSLSDYKTKNTIAHVVGCDSNYFEKFFLDFLKSFDETTDGSIDLCVHISNPTDSVHKIIKKLSNRENIFFSYDNLQYKNIKTYFTETRFILAYHIRNKYDKFVFSDVDIDLKTTYNDFVASNDYDVYMKKTKAPKIPWRGVDAKFIIVSALDKEKFDIFVGGMVRHFLYTFLPDLNPNGNRQWWIDQYSLAIIADSIRLGRKGYNGINVRYYDPKEIPVIVAEDFNISREDFSRRNQ